MTPDDLATIAEFVGSVVHDAGLPTPPCTWWEIDLPDGMTYEHLDALLEKALTELYARGTASPRDEHQVISTVVKSLYEPR